MENFRPSEQFIPNTPAVVAKRGDAFGGRDEVGRAILRHFRHKVLDGLFGLVVVPLVIPFVKSFYIFHGDFSVSTLDHNWCCGPSKDFA